MDAEEEDWYALLTHLRASYDVTEGEGRVVLRGSGRDPRDITLVLTPDQWGDIVDIPCGSVEVALGLVDHVLRERPEDHGYLVYQTYGLVASTTPELPTDPELERLRAWREEHPDAQPGWFAYSPRSAREGGPDRPDRPRE